MLEYREREVRVGVPVSERPHEEGEDVWIERRLERERGTQLFCGLLSLGDRCFGFLDGLPGCFFVAHRLFEDLLHSPI